MPLRVLAGASGYSFKEWKGSFYPPRIRPADMLAFYARHLTTVEINSSFYALPSSASVERWTCSVPEPFRFALKAPGTITHRARLRPESAGDVTALYRVLDSLGDKRGPVLYQLPPSMKKDLDRLRTFLRRLPQQHAAVFEFRHDSWFDREVYDCLGESGAVLCVSEREDASPPPLVETADRGYLRLRRETYATADLVQWMHRLRATPWSRVHAYFMHEPAAPGYAVQFMQLDRT